MHRIITDIERAPDDQVTEFQGIPVSILSDVTGNAGITMDTGLKPITSGITMAGSAVTVKAAPGDNLIIHKAIAMAEPSDVIVVDGEGYTNAAFIGELMAETCQVQGLAGIVIDGAVRDQSGLVKLGFPVYARAIHPRGPLKNDPGSINVPISCGGLPITPGDIVVGDDDGLCAIKQSDAEMVLTAAKEKITGEHATRDQIQQGNIPFEMAGYQEKLDEFNIATE